MPNDADLGLEWSDERPGTPSSDGADLPDDDFDLRDFVQSLKLSEDDRRGFLNRLAVERPTLKVLCAQRNSVTLGRRTCTR